MWPSPGAPHTGVFVRNLSQALTREGFRVDNTAIIAGKGKGLQGRARVHLALAKDILTSVGAADLLYVHAPSWFAPLTLAAARARAKKLVLHMHGGEVFPFSRVERLSQPAVAFCARRADLVVCPSRYYTEQVSQALRVPASRCFVSPSGGVDTTRFTPGERDAARAQLGLPRAGFIAGFVGRIVEDKGWDVALAAVESARARGHEVLGLFVGDGPDATALKQAIDAKSLSAHVFVLGLRPQAELPVVYRAMDAFLFPTRRGAEALGLVPLEAMACGVPVVGSNAYAVPEYVVEGETGFMAAPRDVGGFANGIERILTMSEPERRRLRDGAVAMARRYDTARITRQLAREIAALIERGAG